MTMKNIFKILAISVIALVLPGCFDDPGTDVLLTEQFVSFSLGSQQTTESDLEGEILVEISRAQDVDVVVNFSVTGSNAVNGADFTLVGNSVTIPAGEYSATIPYTVEDDVLVQSEPRSFTVEIESLTPAAINLNGNAAITVSILDDDCVYDASTWAGTYDAVEDYGSSTYGPYDLELVQDLVNPNRFNMEDFYDSGLDAYIVFDGPSGTVSFPDDQEPVAGLPITNSSGTFKQCTNEIIITLTFNGDTFQYILVKQ